MRIITVGTREDDGEQDSTGSRGGGRRRQVQSTTASTFEGDKEEGSLPAANATTALNCGYNCSRYVYNQPVTRHSYDMLTDEERVVIKDEYYRTYDLMTGLRTAASLGGTILLFSLFILYKMKCRHGTRRSRRKSMAPSSIVTLDGNQRDLEKELSLLPINGNRSSVDAGAAADLKSPTVNYNASYDGGGGGGNSRRGSRVVLESNLDHRLSASPSSVCDGAKLCGGGGAAAALPAAVHVPRLRLNSEPDEDRGGHHRPMMTSAASACFLVEPSIDIHIIQPTPNISPCGSVRRLSEDVQQAASFSDAIPPYINRTMTSSSSSSTATVFIPLLTIPIKTRTKDRVKSSAGSSSKTPRSSRDQRRISDSQQTTRGGDCGCSSINTVPSTDKNCPIGDDDRHRRPRRLSNVEMKFIDGSDSDVCPSDCLCDSQPNTPKFISAPEVHRLDTTGSGAVSHLEALAVIESVDEPSEDQVSETTC